ncbi:MAG: family 78 glycoside hydrolase catalytic domain [Arachnia sp.]
MSPTRVSASRLEYGTGACPVARPRLSWITTTDEQNWRQVAAEVAYAPEGGAPRTAVLDGAEQVFVAWPFDDLAPRERGEVRVRVRGDDGWSDWGEAAPVEASFLAPGEWVASWIGLAEPERAAQPVLLRRAFRVGSGLRRATWYATALGVYQAEVNGAAVDDQLLKPGWTAYQFRTVHETTDVTDLLHEGDNAAGVALTGGWYTEEYGFQGQAATFYGAQPRFAGQLLLEYEDGAAEWVATDDSWLARGDGPWVKAGIYYGEDYDARRTVPGWSSASCDESGWARAAVGEPGPAPEAHTAPAVRVTETVPVAEVLTSPSGRTLLDFGQNLVGRLRIRVAGPAGHTVTLRHAEVLEDGELGVRPLRVARASDVYTLAGDGVEEYAPTFTFHGFRYAEVEGWPGAFDPAAVTAEVIGSDLRRTGRFECSDPLVSRLHENVVWGMRSNFLSLPTDCPQRDERLGWTGDIQVFAPTASFLFDCDGFLAHWLRDLALEQEAAGGVPFIVPDVLRSGVVPAAAWGDAATVVPTVLHERFGDLGTLARQYPSMRAWVEQVLAVAGERRLWEGGFQFGDWVDPDAPPDNPAKAKADPDLVASAYLFLSSTLLARAAGLLGHADDADRYARIAAEVRAAWQREYVTPAGRLLSDAQTAYALGIVFGLVDEPQRSRLGDRLAALVRRDGYRIGTGFVGTPIILDALSSTGHAAQAARMLLQTECPSWLYSVQMGATTIWERWDSLLEDGSINPGEMTSFNHYALGSVADWLHRVVAGLAPAAPGYRRLRIQPTPLPGLSWARASFESPYGPASVAWRVADGVLTVTAEVPANAEAEVLLPGQDALVVGSGSHRWEVPAPTLAPAPGWVDVDTALSDVRDDDEAYRAVVDAFRRIDPEVARDFQRRTAWLPNQSLRSAFALIAPSVAAEVEGALAALNEARGLTREASRG